MIDSTASITGASLEAGIGRPRAVQARGGDGFVQALRQELERTGGGYTITAGGKVCHTLPLPILGLISDWPHEKVDKRVKEMTALAYQMGVNPGISPFITLSFMALPVIPELRLTARGMFDVVKFAFCDERGS